MTATTTPRCGDRRQLTQVVMSVPLLMSAWAWIGVVSYQRWGNKPIDLTQPDQIAFAVAAVLILLASQRAARLLVDKAKQVREQQQTCPDCRRP